MTGHLYIRGNEEVHIENEYSMILLKQYDFLLDTNKNWATCKEIKRNST